MSSTLGKSRNPFQTTKYNLACAVLLTKALAQLAERSWMNSNRKISVRIKGWKCQENLADCNLFQNSFGTTSIEQTSSTKQSAAPFWLN